MKRFELYCRSGRTFSVYTPTPEDAIALLTNAYPLEVIGRVVPVPLSDVVVSLFEGPVKKGNAPIGRAP